MPAAPKAAKDIFQLCRGFERAFSTTIDSVDYSALIRGTFTGDNGLKGTVNRLPIERQFKLDNVKAVCRQADGFQKSLVSPEFGLKRLVSEAVETVADPVTSAVYKIHLVLIDAAREAARKASAFADVKAVNETRTPLQLPGFEKQVVFAAQQALEAWREEALTVAKTLVTMEQSYVTAAFFRHRTRERWNQIKIQQMEQELVEGGGNQVGSEDDSGDEESNVRRSLDSSPPINRNELATYSTTSSVGGPLAGGLTIPQQAQNPDDPGDLKTGYLEKRVGEHSGRQSVPGESFKWQKRYFVLTEPKGMLYYFKSADDPPNYRGVINLKECRVEDVDVDGIARSTSSKAGDQSAVSLLIKIGHKDPTRPIVKNHHSVVLRAESAAEKYSWLSRLKNASSTGGARTPPTKMDSSQKMAQSQRDQQTADYKPEQRKSPDPNSQRYSQPKTPHPVQNSGFGGTVLFHENSNIGPEPLMNSSAVSAQAQDEFLRQLAEDTAAYVRTVCNTLVLTVPKAIVHCQVKRAQNHLLEALYAHISSLKQFETDTMLEENPEAVQRRAATKKASLPVLQLGAPGLMACFAQALGDLEDAVAEVKSLMERAGENDKEVNFPIGHPQEIKPMAEMYLADKRAQQLPQEPNQAFCYDMLNKVSRSFAIVIQQLPQELRTPICVFYLVLRALDTVEDDMALTVPFKVPVLKSFHEKISDKSFTVQCGSGHYKRLMEQYPRVTEVFLTLKPEYQKVIAEITNRMGAGMAKFIEKEVETCKEFDEYCHYVAGLVGVGLSKMMASSGLEAPHFNDKEELSNHMGLFLQKTNIIRDYLEDILEEPAPRMFWPREIWGRYAEQLADFQHQRHSKAAVQCLNHMITDALRHAPYCLQYLEQVRNHQNFRFCAIPQIMAIGTLSLCYNNPKVFAGVVKMRRGQVAFYMSTTHNMADVYRAFLRFSHILQERQDADLASGVQAIPKGADPNAAQTKAAVQKIQAACDQGLAQLAERQELGPLPLMHNSLQVSFLVLVLATAWRWLYSPSSYLLQYTQYGSGTAAALLLMMVLIGAPQLRTKTS
eukprot:jgi/Astpho2/3150/Aster-03429